MKNFEPKKAEVVIVEPENGHGAASGLSFHFLLDDEYNLAIEL